MNGLTKCDLTEQIEAGIRSVCLLPIEGLEVTFCADEQRCRVKLPDGVRGLELACNPAETRFVQTDLSECNLWHQQLMLAAASSRPVLGDAFAKIRRLIVQGVVAVIETSPGDRYLMGYSFYRHELLPLRVGEGAADYGRNSSSRKQSQHLTLECTARAPLTALVAIR